MDITFTCGSCGMSTDSLDEMVQHLTKNDWYCWHKEHGGYFDIKLAPHACGRDYCLKEQRERFGPPPVGDFN